MTLSNLGEVPADVLVQFEGVSYLVRPQVEYLGREVRTNKTISLSERKAAHCAGK